MAILNLAEISRLALGGRTYYGAAGQPGGFLQVLTSK